MQLLLALLLGLTVAFEPGVAMPPVSFVDTARVRVYTDQASWILDTLLEFELFYRAEVYPVEQVIAKKNPKDSKKIAWALVKHAYANKIPVDFALGILMVENPWYDPRARSSAGAIGITQVMPFHAGKWACGKSLYNIEVNICTGFKIFAHNRYQEDGNLHRALLRYNGCVKGRRTKDCKQYPTWVRNKTELAKRQLAEFTESY